MDFKRDLKNNKVEIVTESKDPIIWLEGLLNDIGLCYKQGWRDQYCDYKRKPKFDGSWKVYYEVEVEEYEVKHFEFFEYLASFLEYQIEVFRNSLEGIEISYTESEGYFDD